jgi:hypothetical protein
MPKIPGCPKYSNEKTSLDGRWIVKPYDWLDYETGKT